MGPTTGRPDADAAGFLEFLERCHDALRQHTGGCLCSGRPVMGATPRLARLGAASGELAAAP